MQLLLLTFLITTIVYYFDIKSSQLKTANQKTVNFLYKKLIQEHSQAFYAKLEIARILHANKPITEIHCGCKGLFCPAVCNTDLQTAIAIHNNLIQNTTREHHQ